MGSKRPSKRTLPSGEKVMHYPDGTIRLIPEGKVARFLATIQPETDQAAAALDTRIAEAIQAKIDSLDAGDSVPHDKRPI